MKSCDEPVFNTKRESVHRFNRGLFNRSEREQAGIKEFISSGKGLVCLHISCHLDLSRPDCRDITGGGWIGCKSLHSPYGKVPVKVSGPKHPGARGVADFTADDELHMGMGRRDGNDVFITGSTEEMPGGACPSGRTRKRGDGKVFVLLPGHDGQSCQTAESQKIVLNGVDWVTGG